MKIEKKIEHELRLFWTLNKKFISLIAWFLVVGGSFLLLYESDWTVIDPNQEDLTIKELVQLEFARLAGLFAIVNFVNKILK